MTRPRPPLILWFVTAVWLFTVGCAKAEWVRATGFSPIYGGDLQAARLAAQQDALRNAAMQAGAEVASSEVMQNGRIVESRLDVESLANIRRYVTVDEQISDAQVRMTVDVELTVLQPQRIVCPRQPDRIYRKAVAFLGFSLQHPEQAMIGSLQDIERGIGSFLTTTLAHSDYLVTESATQLRLYDEVMNAPTHETQQRLLTRTVAEARQLGVQFVVSGVVRDVSLRDSEAFKPTRLNKALRWLGVEDTQRRMAVDLFVHDGFSGTLVMTKRYETAGLWNSDADQEQKFLSDSFSKLDYGQKVEQLLTQMARDVEQTIACQPFMTRITRVKGREILFEAGAGNNIRPGDRFQVYRTRPLYDNRRFQGTHLENVQMALQVQHVQPEFSLGEVRMDPTRLNIQTDDILVYW